MQRDLAEWGLGQLGTAQPVYLGVRGLRGRVEGDDIVIERWH